ncbi:MAG: hypothetical protein ACYSX1_07485, partial [Planctomycetota bacterium]
DTTLKTPRFCSDLYTSLLRSGYRCVRRIGSGFILPLGRLTHTQIWSGNKIFKTFTIFGKFC